MKRSLFLLSICILFACNTYKHQGAALNLSDARKQLQNKRWVLTRFAETDTAHRGTQRDIYITFEKNGSRLRGFAGCDSIIGTYLLNRSLTISNILPTKKWCPNWPVENKLINTLEKIDNFVVNGDNLLLIKNDKPLAYFRAVYLNE